MRDVESDIGSAVSDLSRLPTPPSPPEQQRRKSEASRRARRRSSVQPDRRISGDFKVAVKASSFTLDTCKVLYKFVIILFNSRKR